MSGLAVIAVELALALLVKAPELRDQYERMKGYRDRNEEPPVAEFLDVLQRINANSARIQQAAAALGVAYKPLADEPQVTHFDTVAGPAEPDLVSQPAQSELRYPSGPVSG